MNRAVLAGHLKISPIVVHVICPQPARQAHLLLWLGFIAAPALALARRSGRLAHRVSSGGRGMAEYTTEV